MYDRNAVCSRQSGERRCDIAAYDGRLNLLKAHFSENRSNSPPPHLV
jgi:hypothetical protein